MTNFHEWNSRECADAGFYEWDIGFGVVVGPDHFILAAVRLVVSIIGETYVAGWLAD